ncbi:MAG: riboflavin synthase [Dehalococcoidales bacterium]
MFTGITEEIGKIVSSRPGRLAVAAERVLDGLELGDSINVNGVCLTVTESGAGGFSADVMPETLRRTNLGGLRAGDGVNLERALAFGGRLGGHLVQGHIDGTGRLATTTPDGDAVVARFDAPPEVMRYVVDKGFIAVDGISLTVVGRSTASFEVALVGFTCRRTTLGGKRSGAAVNLEVDIIAKYVEALSGASSGISSDFLREHGFAVG